MNKVSIIPSRKRRHKNHRTRRRTQGNNNMPARFEDVTSDNRSHLNHHLPSGADVNGRFMPRSPQDDICITGFSGR